MPRHPSAHLEISFWWLAQTFSDVLLLLQAKKSNLGSIYANWSVFLSIFFLFPIWRSMTDLLHFCGSEKCRLWTGLAVDALKQRGGEPPCQRCAPEAPAATVVAQPWVSILRTQTPAGDAAGGASKAFSTHSFRVGLMPIFFQGVSDQGEHEPRLLSVFAEQAPALPQSGPARGHQNPLVLILLPWLFYLKLYLLSIPQRYWGQGETDLIN